MYEQSSEDLESLRRQVFLHKSLEDRCPQLICRISRDGRIIDVNHSWKTTMGYREERLGELTFSDVILPPLRDEYQHIITDLLQQPRTAHYSTQLITAAGELLPVEGEWFPFCEDGETTMITGIFRDLTREAARERALADSEQRYRTLFENSSDLMQIVSADGRFLHVNPAWLTAFGYSRHEVDDLTIFDLIADDCHDHCQNTFQMVLNTPGTHQVDTVFLARDGARIEIEGNATAIFRDGQAIYTQCIFRDVTEKRRMERELARAQKLESIGVFAGGLAHDFNNLLTAILGNISLSRAMLPPGAEVDERLLQVEKAALRARGLTRQLLTFAKGGDPVKKVTKLNELIRDAVEFPLQGTDTRCRFVLPDQLWPAEVDRDQFGRVLQNLAINGGEAMSQGGVLQVTAENTVIETGNTLGLAPGPYIMIRVKDQGKGIAAEDQKRIFDPYFTSKPEGTGLGLAVAYAIMKKHGGLITVESTPGEGAEFSLYLPAAPEQEENTVTPDTGGIPGPGPGRVLIMDDEEMVREVTAAMIRRLGYDYDTAASGEEALEIYRQAMDSDRPFDLVLLDLTVPGGMSGQQTLEELRKMDPAVLAIACSGYTQDPVMARFEDYGFSGVVPKPFEMNELSETLKRVLAGGTTG